MSKQILDTSAYQRALEVRDLTDAALGIHAMQLLVQNAIEALRNLWHCPVIVYRARPVASVGENYDLRYRLMGRRAMRAIRGTCQTSCSCAHRSPR